MRRLWIAVLAALVPTISVAQFRLQDARPITPKLIKAGRFLDVRTGRYLMNQGIFTNGERIKEVGPWEQVQSHAPKDATLIDLGRATLLPGLIDSHSHLLVSMATGMSGGEGITTAVTLMSPEFRTLLGSFHAKEYLEAGVTSIRVGHSGITGDIALRDAIRAGLVAGPRLQAAGRKITPLGGGSTYLQPGIAKEILDLEYLTVSGPDEARRAVRENLAIGADLIKVQMEAGAGAFWKFRYMAPEDVKAIVEDAHRLGMKVAAHAVDKANIQAVIDAGVDSVKHAFQATDAQQQAMKDKGIFMVATDIPDNGGSLESKDRLQRALKIGVKIAMGSDLWFAPSAGMSYGQAALRDLQALHDEGMPNVDDSLRYDQWGGVAGVVRSGR